MDVRVAFFGSGSPLSASALREVARRHDVGIVIEPDRRVARRDRLKRFLGLLPMTPLAAAARQLGLHRIGYRPEEMGREIRSSCIDLIVIASFPFILPETVLAVPAINLHQSLLPRHRGADPLFWTYHANDPRTGVTIHWVGGGVDAGDIISQSAMPLPRGYPMPQLYDDLSRSGAVQLADAIDAIESGRASRIAQDPAEATREPPPATRTWRVEFDTWPAERTWHFLSGIGSTYGALCRDPSGRDMPVGRSATFAPGLHRRRPGTWERQTTGSLVLYCPDGTVTSVP